MIESATFRLDMDSTLFTLEEIPRLYHLFLSLAEEVKKLQVESNKLYGGDDIYEESLL
jgi:hypothetical protein